MLIIAEKPELALAIAKAYSSSPRKSNNSYYDCGQTKITWCYGHMLALCDPEDYDPKYEKWSMEDLPIPIPRPWKKKVIKGSERQVNIILKMIGDAKTIIHAGDPDEEGQLIVDELLILAGKGRTQGKPIKRLLINDNNLKSVKKALANLQDNSKFRGLFYMAEARSVADQSFGYNLSRAYTLAANSKKTLSLGRVQTPILGLIVRRDLEKANHKKSYYYTLKSEFTFSGMTMTANYLFRDTDPVDGHKRVIDPNFFEKIATSIHHQKAIIQAKKQENKIQNAPLPYNLLKLQADCSDLLNISMDETLAITQVLRTKYELITYNRSTSEYLNEERHNEAPYVLNAIKRNLSEYTDKVNQADPKIKSRAFDDKKVDSHHAIIPTETVMDLDLTVLTQKERGVYELIARQYLAQFYGPYQYEQTRLLIRCENYLFVATSNKPLKPGWKILYTEATPEEVDDQNDDENKIVETINVTDLSSIMEKTEGHNSHAEVMKNETRPKPHYTEKTLLQDITRVAKYVKDEKLKKVLIERDKDKKGEHGGIGTPATRSEIVKTLIKRGFIEKKGRTLKSTLLGQDFYHALPDSVKYPDMTAIWHEQQLGIKNGTMKTEDFLTYLEQFVAKEIQALKTNPDYIKTFSEITDNQEKEASKYQCPKCQSNLIKRKGKNGLFWACTGYPNCKETFKNGRNKPVIAT